MKGRAWLRILLLLLVAAAGAGLWRFTHLPGVTVAEVRRGTAAEIVYATGVVEPRRWAMRAPMDGVVLRKDGEVGEVVATTGDETLFWIGEPRPLRIVADVNEDDIPRVTTGQKALLRSDGYKDQILQATVAEITPKGDPVNKTFRVYLSLPDDTPLAIGMSVEANIVVAERKDVLLVPGEALVDGAAFRLDGRRLRRTQLELGLRGTRMVEVLAGLKDGDLVASPASTALRDGERVRILGDTPADRGAATGREGAPKGAAP